MDKSGHSSGGDSSGANSATTITSGGGGRAGGGDGSIRDGYLNQLNKISHKISKPIRRPSPVLEPQLNQSHANLNHQVTSQSQPFNQHQNLHPQQQQQQNQPPVYNINKSDFRDVVQRLTGSPAHERERFSNPAPPPRPPPMQQPRPPSSRLHRIRPPPLAQISNRPPNLLNCAPPPQRLPTNQPVGGSSGGFPGGQRQPLSPLPPFPSVHGAAESPISAYMRYLNNAVAASDNEAKRFQPPLSPLAPRLNNYAPPPLPLPPLQQQNVPPPPHQHQQQQNVPPPPPPQNQQQQNVPPPQQNQQQQNAPPPPATSSAPYPQFPSLPGSPLPFGCLPSPGLLSPSMLFSPTGQMGFQQVPLSPTMPVPSPKWNDM